MRERLEYVAAWMLLQFLGRMPRPLARWTAGHMATMVFRLQPAWRRAALFNLRLAFPEWSESQRELVVRSMVRKIGWVMAEFAHFPYDTPADFERIMVVDGEENFDAAERRGKGVLLLTGHLGAWELI